MKKPLSIILRAIVLLASLGLIVSCESSSTTYNNYGAQQIKIKASQAYKTRKEQYLQYCNDNNGPGMGGLYGQTCRAYTGAGTFNETAINDGLAWINARKDVSDFRMNAILRILFLDRANPTLPPALRDEMKAAVLNFKYWLDEDDPNPDNLCWWSENHQILYHTAELLAGILYPDEIFSNVGMTGRQHMEHARPLLHKWLDYRGRFGFSEFHSNIYFNEDMPPLVNLVDYADEESLRIKAAMLLDVLAFDMLTNTYKGNFATTHGRTYKSTVENGLYDSTTEAEWLMLGNVPIASINELGVDNFSATFLATSDNYETPPLLEAIAQDSTDNFEHKQRDGIKISDGPAYGITYTDFKDIIFWWGMTAYMAPETIDGSFNLIDYYNLWISYQWKDVTMLQPFVGTQMLIGVATDVAPLTKGAALEEVSTYTYRTPYYQLSGAQDWKPFSWTGQVLAWQATLDKDCYVFTSMPLDLTMLFGTSFGDEWTGGFIPRTTIYKNVGIFQYHLPALGSLAKYLPPNGINWAGVLPTTVHAFFPRLKFDEYRQVGNWTLGRKGQSYVALYSSTTPTFMSDIELVANNTDNVWIVELGDAVHNGTFAEFVTAITTATVEVGASVKYVSPSRGTIAVAWTGPMLVNDVAVDLGPYERWDNSYAYQEFGTMVTDIEFNGKLLRLDFENAERLLFKK